MEEQLHELKLRLQLAEHRFKVLGGLALVIIAGAGLTASRSVATAQGPGNGLEQRVAALETKVTSLQTAVTTLQGQLSNEIARAAAAEAALAANVSPFTVNGTDVTLSGYNLHI